MVQDSYAASWKYFRRLRATMFGLFAGILPLGLVIQLLLRAHVPRGVVMVLFVAYPLAVDQSVRALRGGGWGRQRERAARVGAGLSIGTFWKSI